MSSEDRLHVESTARLQLVRRRRALPHIDAHTLIRTNVSAINGSRPYSRPSSPNGDPGIANFFNETLFTRSHARRGARDFKCDF